MPVLRRGTPQRSRLTSPVFLEIFLGLLASLQGADAYGLALWLLFSAGVGAPLSQDILLLAPNDRSLANR